MITDKQAIEAIKTIQEYCKQQKYCGRFEGYEVCPIHGWCGVYAEIPTHWLIPQLGGGQND